MAQGQVQWADPFPVGLVGQATAFFGLGALLTGLAPISGIPIIIAWCAMVVLLCVITGIISFRRGDFIFGTINLLFGVLLFGAGAAASFFTKFVGWPWGIATFWVAPTEAGLAISPIVEGWFWMVPTVFLGAFALLCLLKVSWLVGLAIFDITVAVGFLSAWCLLGCPGITAPTAGIVDPVAMVAGILIFIFGALNWYFAVALFSNTIYARPVLPIGRPLVK